ncbi:MAG TPA: hypothetical protein PK228_00975, partial [Saprospiraceae bacterium]|nr:hypothetical protein [Saprospiraceae bacterium]
MKPSLFALLFFLLSHALQAIDTYQPGDTLYVWATSGLSLRKDPSLQAARLTTIPYGTMVIAQNYYNGHDVEVEAAPGYMSNGQK